MKTTINPAYQIASAKQIAAMRCNLNHSGNRTFYRTTVGWSECQGCGAFVSDESIIAEHKNQPRSFTGSGGYYRVSSAR